MKYPKFAYQITPGHDPKGGAVFVRAVEIVEVLENVGTALVSFTVNGREHRQFAELATLASTPAKLAEKLAAALPLPAADQVAGAPKNTPQNAGLAVAA